jgi:ring-1,2-phenylacetyl-CoA epoxidase subunit PaaC
VTAPPPDVAGPRATPAANPLFEFVVRLADDRLVLGHRLSEWCGHAPILEEDIALANVALDFIGQASAMLALAGKIEGTGRDEDALAYFRDERHFRNCLLAEQPNGDFAATIVRQFLFDAWSVLYLDALAKCGRADLAALAAKALKEDSYHLRHSSQWMLRLGDGTPESRERAQRALNDLWRFTGELFEFDAVDAAVARQGIAVDLGAIRARWHEVVADVVRRATLTIPAGNPVATGGRTGRHTEHLGHMIAEMQIVARSHPGAAW